MSQAQPKHSLFYTAFCPYCVRVLNVMNAKTHEVELLDIYQGSNSKVLRAGGGKTQVPCLRITENGKETWMYESSDIVQYLSKGSYLT